jgi:hypothetical protein
MKPYSSILICFIILFSWHQTSYACSDKMMIGPYEIKAYTNNPIYDDATDSYIWGYELVNDKNPRSIWFGVEKGIDVWNPEIGVHYQAGEGAGSTSQNFGRGIFSTRVFEIITKGKRDYTDILLYTNTPDTGCVSVAVQGGTQMAYNQIKGPGSFLLAQEPGTVPTGTLTETLLPESFDGMRRIQIESGTDGCAHKVSGFCDDNGWVELAKYPIGEGPVATRKFTGMPGQKCPGGFQLQNPCYFFSGSNYYVIPCTK